MTPGTPLKTKVARLAARNLDVHEEISHATTDTLVSGGSQKKRKLGVRNVYTRVNLKWRSAGTIAFFKTPSLLPSRE